jgi:hypothetical protein
MDCSNFIDLPSIQLVFKVVMKIKSNEFIISFLNNNDLIKISSENSTGSNTMA